MDNNGQNNLPQNLVSESDLAADLNLTGTQGNDKQALIEKAREEITKRVLERIAYALTDKDMQALEELDKESNSSSLKYFLLAKIPNIEEIVKEEIDFYKEENPPQK